MILRRLKFLALSAVIAVTPGCVSDPAPRAQAAAAPVAVSPSPPVTAPAPDLAARLQAVAEGADPQVIRLAVQAQDCAIRRGEASPRSRLAVIDYSRPSTEPRLWVFDPALGTLLYREVVAHGRNTGANLANRFSNVEGSLQSSLGLFRTAETYIGENGYSMRMDGLEPGVNDLARPRAIVMHGAWYVDPLAALKQGRLGRSLGCPALRPQIARQVIDTLKDGQLLFAYYPDRRWLSNSRYFGCRQDEPRRGGAVALHATAR